MKNLILSLLIIGLTCGSFAQTETGEAIEKTYPIPEFTATNMADGKTFTNQGIKKGKPTLIMLFSPGCGHCKHVTEVLLENIEQFKKTSIYLITWLPEDDVKEFYNHYKIEDFKEITLGKVEGLDLLTHYDVRSYPKLITYDKNLNYLDAFDRNFEMSSVWESLKQTEAQNKKKNKF